MKRIITMTILLILNFILQSTLLQHIRLNSVIPNTAIVIIVSMSLLRGRTEGSIIGFCSGFLQDIFFGSSLGFYALLGMLIGYYIGKYHANYYRENFALPVFFCFIVTIIYETIIFIFGPFFNGSFNYIYFFIRKIIPCAVYTAVTAIIIYRLLFTINDILEKSEKHKRKLFSIK